MRLEFFVAVIFSVVLVAVTARSEFVPIGGSESPKAVDKNSKALPASGAIDDPEPLDLSLKSKPAQTEKISGTVRIVRRGEQTEVFFKELPGVYTIAPNSAHNQVLQKCLESQKTGKGVSFLVESESRRIIGLGEAKSSGSGQ